MAENKGEELIGKKARFKLHQGFVGTVEASTRQDTDHFECELVLADGRRVGAMRHELEVIK